MLTCTCMAGRKVFQTWEGSMSRQGNDFVGDATIGVSLLAGAMAASVANIARARAEESAQNQAAWAWRDAAEYWRARALKAERALAAAEARLDELD